MESKDGNKKSLSLPVLLFSFVSIFLFSVCNPSYAEVEADECAVGDLTKGYWVRIPNNFGWCPIPGPPAAESPWGWGADINSTPYRIQGHYKVLGAMTSDGYALEPPPSRPECITGYAEAFAKAYCIGKKKSGAWTTTWTASSTLCAMVTTGPNNYYHAQYVRYYDWAILYEWRCRLGINKEKNYGGICSVPQN